MSSITEKMEAILHTGEEHKKERTTLSVKSEVLAEHNGKWVHLYVYGGYKKQR